MRVVRDGTVIYETTISQLKRFKDDAREVAEGFECGILLEGFNDVKEGDVLEAYETREVERTSLDEPAGTTPAPAAWPADWASSSAERDDAVAPERLRRIERAVGHPHEHVPVRRVVGNDATPKLAVMSRSIPGTLTARHLHAELLRQHDRSLGGVSGKQDQELLAAVAAGEVARRGGDARRAAPRRPATWSPLLVAVAVVDLLEVVEVEQSAAEGDRVRDACATIR